MTQEPRAVGRRLRTLHRASFQAIVGTWPLTVDTATPVQGARNPWSIGVIVNGVTYALNGTARTWEHWPPLDPIWADDTQIPGTKISITDLLDFAAARLWGDAAPATPVTPAARPIIDGLAAAMAPQSTTPQRASDQPVARDRGPADTDPEALDRRARAVIGKPLDQCTAADLERLAADTSYINAELVVELAALELESPSKSGDDE